MSDELSMTDAIGNAGALPQIHWNGRVYSVAHATPSAVQRVEAEVARAALANVSALKGVIPPGEYAESRAETLAAIQTKQHGYNKPLYQTAVLNDFLPHVLFGCVTERHPELTMADVYGMFRDSFDDVEAALVQVGPDFFVRGGDRTAAPPEERAKVAESYAKHLRDLLAQGKESRGSRPA